MINENCKSYFERRHKFLYLSSCSLKDQIINKKYVSYILKYGCDSCEDFKEKENGKKV